MQADVELEIHGARFYSGCDEATFFDWLGSIPAVLMCERHGEAVIMKVAAEAVDGFVLRELVALFHRYKLDMRPLASFDGVEVAEWPSTSGWEQSIPRATFPSHAGRRPPGHSS